jgi:branched-chain amino acid aminotransferase
MPSANYGNYWIWIDGKPVPGENARVPVLDRGFLYGDSVYEVTRTVQRKPLFFDLHLARLARSATGLFFDIPPINVIEQAVTETISAASKVQSDVREFYLRVIVTRGAGELDLDPASSDGPRLIVIVKPLKLPEARLYREGASVATVNERRNAPGHIQPEVKSGNYLTSVMALAAARRRGCYEALMLDLYNQIAEGASSNFFMLAGGRLITPPRSVGILSGITRGTVLKLAGSAGVPVVEAPIALRDAIHADEAFITSSIRGVMPVIRIDEYPIGVGRPGPITRRLMQLYFQLIGDTVPA